MIRDIAFCIGVFVIVATAGAFLVCWLDKMLTSKRMARRVEHKTLALVIKRSEYWNRGTGNLFCYIAERMRELGMDPAKPFAITDFDFFVFQRPLVITQQVEVKQLSPEEYRRDA